MRITETLLTAVAERAERATSRDLRIGGHWTAVTIEVDGEIRGGLSSTLSGGGDDHHHGGGPPVRDAGRLLDYAVPDLLALARSESLLEASVGFATLNALLEVNEAACREVNAADVIAERGAGKSIAVVGHFPFVRDLREVAEQVWVLELHPREGDIPAARAGDVLPQADVVALTGTSLLNHTFDDLIAHCHPRAFVVVLGGTTPLSPVLFGYGVDAVAGTLLVDPAPALLAVSQGATFRQIPGKRLVTLFRDEITP